MGSAAYKDQTHGTIPPVANNATTQPSGDTRTMLNGIDIYHGDGAIDWKNLKTDFIFIKATEGITHRDNSFRTNMASARNAGIPCGAYHFYRPGNPIQQAQNFCDYVGAPQVGDLPMVLDWEDELAVDIGEIHQFLDYLENTTKVTPIIYSGLSFIQDKKLADLFTRYPLWLAHYSKTTETPKPWDHWTFWQWSDKGPSGYDSNYFNGGIDQLNAMRKK